MDDTNTKPPHCPTCQCKGEAPVYPVRCALCGVEYGPGALVQSHRPGSPNCTERTQGHAARHDMTVAIALLIAAQAATHLNCGVERRAVKTLADVDAATIIRLPAPSTIGELRALPPPAPWTGGLPRQPDETRVVTVEARIVAYKVEADNDLHVVLADPAAVSADGAHWRVSVDSLIAEFPHPDCAGKGYRAEFAAARRALAVVLRGLPKPSPRVTHLPAARAPRVLVTGVVFWDKVHGQLGVAPSGVELHPCFDIERAP